MKGRFPYLSGLPTIRPWSLLLPSRLPFKLAPWPTLPKKKVSPWLHSPSIKAARWATSPIIKLAPWLTLTKMSFITTYFTYDESRIQYECCTAVESINKLCEVSTIWFRLIISLQRRQQMFTNYTQVTDRTKPLPHFRDNERTDKWNVEMGSRYSQNIKKNI